jgi:hypothetical protein
MPLADTVGDVPERLGAWLSPLLAGVVLGWLCGGWL